MKNLFAAIRFITILPAGRSEHFDAMGMVPWFPVAGLLLGALLAVFDLAAARLWPVSAVSILDVILLAILTGAFHLDGLGDTADGLFSHRPRERILEIMKDSRIGVMGVVAVVSVLAVKWAGISGLGANRTALLILVPAYARCGHALRHAGPRLRPSSGRHGPCRFSAAHCGCGISGRSSRWESFPWSWACPC